MKGSEKRASARIARLLCGAAVKIRSPPVDGMTLDSGLYRIEWAGIVGPRRLGDILKLPGLAGPSSDRQPQVTPVRTFTSGFAALLGVLVAGAGAWGLLSGYGSSPAGGDPAHLATVDEPVPTIPEGTGEGSLTNPAAAPAEAPPPEISPVTGLKIASQSWRRGGLGSKALVTLTLRNGNDYAVKDIEIFCSFARRDGSHLTDRRRMIHETVNMKSRKTFARMHVGFVNINANQAKCSLITASRI